MNETYQFEQYEIAPTIFKSFGYCEKWSLNERFRINGKNVLVDWRL